MLSSSIYCLRLLRSGFPARAKESHFGGMISDKEDNMHSKALKTNKQTNTKPQTNKQNLNNEKLLFVVHVRSHTPHPFPKITRCKLLSSAAATPGPRNKGGPDHVSRGSGISHTLANRCAGHRRCWGWGWGQPPRDCTSEAG